MGAFTLEPGAKINIGIHYGTFNAGAENVRSTSTAHELNDEALNDPEATFPSVSETPGDPSTVRFGSGGALIELGLLLRLRHQGGFFVEAGPTFGISGSFIGGQKDIYEPSAAHDPDNNGVTAEDPCGVMGCTEEVKDEDLGTTLSQSAEKSNVRGYSTPFYLDTRIGYKRLAVNGGIGINPHRFPNGLISVDKQREGEGNENPDGMTNQAIAGQSQLNSWATPVHWRLGADFEVIPKGGSLGPAGLRVYAQYAHTRGGELRLNNDNIPTNSEFTLTGATDKRFILGGTVSF